MKAQPRSRALLVLAGCSAWLAVAGPTAEATSPLISRIQAQQHGLDRQWFTQVDLDPARSRIAGWTLALDELFLLTDSGIVQALDVETGRTAWVTRIGNPLYASLGPAANQEYVAFINGSTLYVLNRNNGRAAIERMLGGGPGAGPALAESYAYIPMINGRIEGYSLRDRLTMPWFYQSFGRTLVPPLIADGNVIWTTDAGYLYFARASNPQIRLRLESPHEFNVSPAHADGTIYAASIAGEVFALADNNGRKLWKYAMTFPASGPPAVIQDRVFVTSDAPALHCIDATTGQSVWVAPRVLNFAAVSKTHVYGLDRSGAVLVLDRQTGSPRDRIPLAGTTTAVVNEQSDRLLLVSETGLVQCLHELGAREPTYYVKLPSDEVAKQPTEEPAEETGEPARSPSEPQEPPIPPVIEPEPFDLDNPFASGPTDSTVESEDDEQADDEENPFGGF